MSKYLCMVALAVMCGVSSASQGFQTDWSGSSGVIGPVIQLGTDYWYDSDVNVLGNPGDLALEYSSQGVPISGIDHSRVVLLDFDQDGDQDIASITESPDGFRILENADGQGTLWNEFMVATVSGYAWTVTAGDFTGDGYPDLVGTDESQNDIILMINPAGAGSWETSLVDDERAAFCLEPADLNGDGMLDLIGGHDYPEFLCCWINLGGATGSSTPWEEPMFPLTSPREMWTSTATSTFSWPVPSVGTLPGTGTPPARAPSGSTCTSWGVSSTSTGYHAVMPTATATSTLQPAGSAEHFLLGECGWSRG